MRGFLDFIKDTPTAFHAANKIANILKGNGYIELNEAEEWNLTRGGKYFFTRNHSSVFAFQIPMDFKDLSFNITAAHLDSPTFKLKPNFTLDQGKYIKLNTEVYGGPIFMSWLDRPLNIAGRVMVKENNKVTTKLLSFNRAICMIPNCSIHYNRELNKGYAFNPQNEMLPILTDNKNSDLLALIAKELNVKKEDILSYDLYLALLDRGMLVGPNNEFVMAPQIDNLECSYGLLNALLSEVPAKGTVNVMCLFDNEEIGSATRQGAASTTLYDLLERITLSLGLSSEEFKRSLASSYFISADNAQGFHPSYASKYDPTNACYMNEGIVVKNAARGSYTTDAYSLAIFKVLCERSGARYQLNTNRSDVPGGSTLGAISQTKVSIPSVDIGLAQVAMHSSYETAGARDLEDLVKAIKEFYHTHFHTVNDGTVEF